MIDKIERIIHFLKQYIEFANVKVLNVHFSKI
jgi:hypothetical protein